ncbi:MAG: response regulator transcription factor [Paracoccaceae bacterium]
MACRILIAEDEPHIVELLSFMLGRAGYEVQTATTGAAALERALAEPPDAMILDVMLPELNGFELLRRLRANPTGRGLPVIMLTAKGQREDRETAARLAVDAFITKPFSNAELLEKVTRLTAARDPAR